MDDPETSGFSFFTTVYTTMSDFCVEPIGGQNECVALKPAEFHLKHYQAGSHLSS